ncbi:AraC family transcriptional regulator [Cyanobium sp. FGCU-52]|nr:AraC family transcriptional regulator [Cyanobium sp. FGCU52]
MSSEHLAERVRGVLDLTSIVSRVPILQSAHQLTLDRMGRLEVAAWLGTGLEIEAATPASPTLYLLQGGRMEVHQGLRTLQAEANELLFLPAAPYRATTTSCAVVAIRPDPAALGAALKSVLGRSLPKGEQERMLGQALIVHAHDAPTQRGIAGALASLLQIFEHLHGVDPQLAEILELDDQIHRLIATLLLAEHRGLKQLLPAQARRLAGEDAFENLLEFLRTHLANSLSLCEMERQSGLSRRALQYLFQHRFGCTPMQWLRRERLELARYQLEQAGPDDSVWSIALRCGYRSPSHFSADFQRRFHCKPSELLRKGAAFSPAGEPGSGKRKKPHRNGQGGWAPEEDECPLLNGR